MTINVNKCHISHVGTRNQCVKDLGVSIASNLKLSQQSKDVAGNVNRMLAFMNKNISFKTKDIILPLYISICREIFVAPPY